MLSLRGSIPRGSSFSPGSCLLTSHRRVHVAVSRRRAMVMNAFDADTTLSSSQSLAYAAVAGMGIVGITAIAITSQVRPGGNVSSLSSTKLLAFLSESNSVLVDIRSKTSIKKEGIPNLIGTKGRYVSSPYTKVDKDGQEMVVEKFGEGFAKMKGLREGSIVILMDRTGRFAPSAAREILNFMDFKKVYYVSNGTSGRGGMQDSGLAWKAPTKGITVPKISLKGLDLDKIAESYKQRPTLFNTGLAVGALATAGVVLFNEFDVILEAVGVLGGANLLFKNFFFAKDRKRAIDGLNSFMNEKVAAKEAGDDLKRLASTILEVSSATESSSVDQSEEKKKTEEVLSESVTNAVPVTDI